MNRSPLILPQSSIVPRLNKLIGQALTLAKRKPSEAIRQAITWLNAARNALKRDLTLTFWYRLDVALAYLKEA